jgi:hypothetical protein
VSKGVQWLMYVVASLTVGVAIHACASPATEAQPGDRWDTSYVSILHEVLLVHDRQEHRCYLSRGGIIEVACDER